MQNSELQLQSWYLNIYKPHSIHTAPLHAWDKVQICNKFLCVSTSLDWRGKGGGGGLKTIYGEEM